MTPEMVTITQRLPLSLLLQIDPILLCFQYTAHNSIFRVMTSHIYRLQRLLMLLLDSSPCEFDIRLRTIFLYQLGHLLHDIIHFPGALCSLMPYKIINNSDS